MKYKNSTQYANQEINLNVNKGEIMGLLGPNGAGKTTLVRQICGILKPSTGIILLDDKDIVKYPIFISNKLAYLSQVLYSQRSLKVSEFLCFTGIYRNLTKKNALYQMEKFIEYFKIERLRNKLISDLSGGEQRIVGFISSLMGLKPFIVLDEPTNDLDTESRILLWKLVKNLKDDLGISFLLVTHNIHEAKDVVDRVAIMKEGRIYKTGRPKDIIENLNIPIKIRFFLPYDIIIPEWLKRKDGFMQIDTENYQFSVQESEVNESLNSLFASDFYKDIKNVEILSPSLEDVFINIG